MGGSRGVGGLEERGLWFDGYTVTYLERDCRCSHLFEDLGDFRCLMHAAVEITVFGQAADPNQPERAVWIVGETKHN